MRENALPRLPCNAFIGKRMSASHSKFGSESIPADTSLGVVIAGVNVLIGIALIIAFI